MLLSVFIIHLRFDGENRQKKDGARGRPFFSPNSAYAIPDGRCTELVVEPVETLSKYFPGILIGRSAAFTPESACKGDSGNPSGFQDEAKSLP